MGRAGRKLTLRARAARMAETRERIVRAAYELHASIGPARTTISAIAARAGVQRHTVYDHFPNELELSAACAAWGLERDPQPDPAELARIADPRERLGAALRQQFAYYERNAPLLANIQRDAPLLRQQLAEAGVAWEALPEVVRAFHEQPGALRDALLPGWDADGRRATLVRAALGLAVAFDTWRALEVDEGLDREQAVALLTTLVAATVDSDAT